MFTDSTAILATAAGLLGAVAVTAVGLRSNRDHRLIACAGCLFGIALGVITHVLYGWYARGFDPLRIWLLSVAVVILLLVMTAQNWFVFYEDRRDAFRSSRPTLVVIAAIIVSAFAAKITGSHSYYFPTLWAAMGSWAVILCLQPIQRSIEINRNKVVGGLVGVFKVLLPLSGIALLFPMSVVRGTRPQQSGTAEDSIQPGFLTNLPSLFWDIGLLLSTILINGARVPPQSAPSDPLEYLLQPKHENSASGDVPRLKRDSVVLVLVVALHVLCGVMIVKA
jgi:hypothetical protein